MSVPELRAGTPGPSPLRAARMYQSLKLLGSRNKLLAVDTDDPFDEDYEMLPPELGFEVPRPLSRAAEQSQGLAKKARQVSSRPDFEAGFDKLEFVPITRHRALTDPGRPLSLAQMKAYYRTWMLTYDTEMPKFGSAMVWAECVYRQMQAATEGLPTPNPLAVAVSYSLLERLAPSFGRFETAVRVITAELLTAIVFQGRPAGTSPSASMAEPTVTLPPSLEVSVIDLPLYYELRVRGRARQQRLQEQLRLLKKNSRHADRVLRTAVMIYRKLVLGTAFRGWRAVCQPFDTW
eukprot:RCo033206